MSEILKGGSRKSQDMLETPAPPRGYARWSNGFYIPAENAGAHCPLMGPRTPHGQQSAGAAELLFGPDGITPMCSKPGAGCFTADLHVIRQEACGLGPLRLSPGEDFREQEQDARELLLNFGNFMRRKILEAMRNPTTTQRDIINLLFTGKNLMPDLNSEDIEAVLLGLLAVASDENIRELCARAHPTSASNEMAIILRQAYELFKFLRPDAAELKNQEIKYALTQLLEKSWRVSELYELYALLDGIMLNEQEKRKILQLMTNAGHLHNNTLAARIGMEEHKKGQEASGWVKEQEDLRERLVDTLRSDPQTLYDSFDTLRAKARHLLFATNPSNYPHNTKIGFETEGRVNRNADGLPDGLEWERYHAHDEIRFKGFGVPYNQAQEILVALWSWKACAFDSRVGSVHVHLDREVHPRKPDFGGLFPEIRNNELGTWELRGFYPPVSAETLLAIIDASARCSQTNVIRPPSRINISHYPSEHWQHLLWGAVCSRIDDPEIRLCFLIALQDPRALIGFDFKAVYETYGAELLDYNLGRILPRSDSHKVAAAFLMDQANLSDLNSGSDIKPPEAQHGYASISVGCQNNLADTTGGIKLEDMAMCLQLEPTEAQLQARRTNKALDILMEALVYHTGKPSGWEVVRELRSLFAQPKPPEGLTDRIVRFFECSDSSVVQKALETLRPLFLNGSASNELVERVAELLNHVNSTVRWTVVDFLKLAASRDSIPERVVDMIVVLLEDSDLDRRFAASVTLQPLFHKGSASLELLERVAGLLDRPDTDVVKVALETLQPLFHKGSASDELVERVAGLLEHPDTDVVERAIRTLGKLLPSETAPPKLLGRFADFLKSSNPSVVVEAIWALAPLLPLEHHSWLSERVVELIGHPDQTIRQEAEGVLEQVVRRGGIPSDISKHITGLLTHPDPIIRGAAERLQQLISRNLPTQANLHLL